MDSKKIFLIAGMLGALAVIFGAFGAHALKEIISADQLLSYKTGVSYHFYHTFLLLVIGILYKLKASKLLRISAWLCIIGILFFSGSIYVLSCKDLIGIKNTAWIGPITPIGGLLFIVSWLLLTFNFIKRDVNE